MAYKSLLERKKEVGGYTSLLERQKGTSVPGLKTPDLTTATGLESVAMRTGLEKKTQKVLATKGETGEIFSGGFISDIFDGVNALQYGVVGILKGKSFSEGVRTRQSFTDQDALGDKGIPGIIGGIALDIAVDPLTYVAPWTVLKKIGVAPKLIKAAKIAEETKVGQWFARKLVYRFGQDPIYKEMAERSIKNIAIGQQNLLEIARPLTKLDSATQKLIGETRKAGKIAELPKELLEKAKPAFDELDKLGKEAVKVGLLPNEIWAKNLGKYMPRLYSSKEEVKKISGIFPTKPKRIDITRFRARKDIPEEVRESMGEILEAGYPTVKGLVQLKAAVENARFFGDVAKKFAVDTLAEGFQKLPDTKRLGKLSGKFVSQVIFDDIQELTRIPTAFEKGAGKIVAGFKFAKVIMNPATHIRNVLSNKVLNWWKLGLGPWRQDIYLEAVQQMAKGGKWIDEAKTVGYNLDTFSGNEIKALLTGPEGKGVIGGVKNLANKLADIYQGEENFAKLAAFIFKRKQGLGIEEAWKAAESATFNYAQVTPFIRQLRESIFGFPFISFTYKATPIVVETIAKTPARVSVFGKIKQAIENASDIKETERERASEPSWVRDGFYIKLPMKDKHGRSSYFDLTYIVPFGDLMSGAYLNRQVSRETGLPESLPESLAEKSPLFNAIKEMTKNQDFYGDKIWKDSDPIEKQLGDLFRYITKTYMPPPIADQIPGGYMTNGERRQTGFPAALDKEGEVRQKRTLMQEMLRHVGAKIQPIDVDIQESLMEWEKRKAIQTILEEEGKVKEFKRAYVPK